MMKQIYSKPKISVEVLTLDQPIALNCVADKGDLTDVMALGYFVEAYSCATNAESVEWGNDTICYHSNIQTAFFS